MNDPHLSQRRSARKSVSRRSLFAPAKNQYERSLRLAKLERAKIDFRYSLVYPYNYELSTGQDHLFGGDSFRVSQVPPPTISWLQPSPGWIGIELECSS
jgi:hypothetical protein